MNVRDLTKEEFSNFVNWLGNIKGVEVVTKNLNAYLNEWRNTR